mmetsp:Transcript_22635/g.63257  ORF Transcript_22635/g.63257 Transcript_22635/m.63257 type:complete len:276 (-) Transcript_22635:544-1371(-)
MLSRCPLLEESLEAIAVERLLRSGPTASKSSFLLHDAACPARTWLGNTLRCAVSSPPFSQTHLKLSPDNGRGRNQSTTTQPQGSSMCRTTASYQRPSPVHIASTWLPTAIPFHEQRPSLSLPTKGEETERGLLRQCVFCEGTGTRNETGAELPKAFHARTCNSNSVSSGCTGTRTGLPMPITKVVPSGVRPGVLLLYGRSQEGTRTWTSMPSTGRGQSSDRKFGRTSSSTASSESPTLSQRMTLTLFTTSGFSAPISLSTAGRPRMSPRCARSWK